MVRKRIIKKYPNRRLYDTEVSRYITIEDVRRLVVDGVDFCVKDVKTDEDLTRSILLQIIAEQEHDGEPLFSTRTLTQLIRFYGNAYQAAFADYLQQSLEIFSAQQQEFQQRLQKTAASNPLAAMTELTQRNLDLWRQVQDNFFKSAGLGAQRKDGTQD
ncbi:MAG: polyhydroxyalkanoate synthesis repressor PhaR [Gammaproteobacteria bacterium]|nr:polyhydroxyalkanoate synthesis repressor PhaR [Gammaproteobacteria bacterium]